MKLLSLLTMSLAAASMSVAATGPASLPQLASPIEIAASESVSVNGQSYNKIVQPSSREQFANTVKLFAGDTVTKGGFNIASKATGVIFITLAQGQDAAEIAKDLGLSLLFSSGTSAVLKASADVDLLTLSDSLNSDSRIAAVKIELANNRYKPE